MFIGILFLGTFFVILYGAGKRYEKKGQVANGKEPKV